MTRDRPLSDEENNWLRSIISDLVVFGTGLLHLNRRDPSCSELPDEQELVDLETMRVTARYELSGGISEGCADSHQRTFTGMNVAVTCL